MTEYTAEDAHIAVSRGAAWLDKRYPAWFKAINLHTLDLHSADYCVLGQTADVLVPASSDDFVSVSPYEAALMHFARKDQVRWAARYGFNLPKLQLDEFSERAEREYQIYYEMLTIAWKVYIRSRLAVSV